MSSFKNHKSSYNPKHDIPEGSREFNFSDDLQYGLIGEAFVGAMLDSLGSGSFEIKTDRYRNGNMVVETDQNPKNNGWKKSGINVTEAKWWVYVYALDGGIVIIDIARLKRYLRANNSLFNEETKRDFAPHSENPARGFILKPRHVMDMLINPQYDANVKTPTGETK
jgi:hypothetical protein